jgi:hypothetical protein
MSHPVPTREYGENEYPEYVPPRLTLLQKVRTPEGDIGHVTGYDEGRLNIRVTFNSRSAWYNDAELAAV